MREVGDLAMEAGGVAIDDQDVVRVDVAMDDV